MITEFILNIPIKILSVVLGWLPDLPAMPSTITDLLDVFIDYLGSGMGFLVKVYSAPLLFALMFLIIAMFNFTRIWLMFNWIYHKIIK